MSMRQVKLADQIRDIVAGCFLGGKMNDPRLENVTVTAVKLSPDLQIATIYYRVYQAEDESIAAAKKGLEAASGHFRRLLGKGLDVRRVPNLRYFYDESIERAERIESLLAKI